jgi:hypothetical protein
MLRCIPFGCGLAFFGGSEAGSRVSLAASAAERPSDAVRVEFGFERYRAIELVSPQSGPELQS